MSYGGDLTEKRGMSWGCLAALTVGLALLVVMAAPAIMRLRDRANRLASQNNLRRIGATLLLYEKDHGHLPPAAVHSKDGKPLLSWRVAILPYVQTKNFEWLFHLDEPWDSRQNHALLAGIPALYQPVNNVDAPPSSTFYQVFVGEGTPFEPNRRISVEDIRAGDGVSYTILAVEAGKAVPWTKPEDLPFAPDIPLPPLGGLFDVGFHALFADQSVRFFARDTEPEVIRRMITWKGGDKVEGERKP
jgi:hypothetical protein